MNAVSDFISVERTFELTLFKGSVVVLFAMVRLISAGVMVLLRKTISFNFFKCIASVSIVSAVVVAVVMASVAKSACKSVVL